MKTPNKPDKGNIKLHQQIIVGAALMMIINAPTCGRLIAIETNRHCPETVASIKKIATEIVDRIKETRIFITP